MCEIYIIFTWLLAFFNLASENWEAPYNHKAKYFIRIHFYFASSIKNSLYIQYNLSKQAVR
jgi:hypothetical protein